MRGKTAFQTTGYDVLPQGIFRLKRFAFQAIRLVVSRKTAFSRSLQAGRRCAAASPFAYFTTKSAGWDGRTRAAAKRRNAGRPASRRKGRTAAVWAESLSERRKDSAGKERRKRAYLLRRTTRLREDRQERRQRWIGWTGTGAGPVLSDGMTTPFAAAWRRRPAYALYLPPCQAGIFSVCRFGAARTHLPFRRPAGTVAARRLQRAAGRTPPGQPHA